MPIKKQAPVAGQFLFPGKILSFSFRNWSTRIIKSYIVNPRMMCYIPFYSGCMSCTVAAVWQVTQTRFLPSEILRELPVFDNLGLNKHVCFTRAHTMPWGRGLHIQGSGIDP